MKCERTTVHFLLPARERRSALLSETPLTTSAFNFPLPYFVELESPTRRKVDSPVSVVGEPTPDLQEIPLTILLATPQNLSSELTYGEGMLCQ